MVEARAALAHVGWWQALPPRWEGTGRWPVPPRWHRVGLRQSLVSGTDRHAAHPVNGLLNDAYAGLEGRVWTAADVPKKRGNTQCNTTPSHHIRPCLRAGRGLKRHRLTR